MYPKSSFHNQTGKGSTMNTILDLACLPVLRALLPFVHLKIPPLGRSAQWPFNVSPNEGGIINISFPRTDAKLWHIEVFCPKEWQDKIYVSNGRIIREVLSEESSGTYPQMMRMHEFTRTSPHPNFTDLSSWGINMAIASRLNPTESELKIIQRLLLEELEKECKVL